jgi:hypothetical protein
MIKVVANGVGSGVLVSTTGIVLAGVAGAGCSFEGDRFSMSKSGISP